MIPINLTQRPPRSPRVRLGGFVLLPRMLDKCRADLAGTIGEYKYGCPLDQRFLQFTGIDAASLKSVVATGAGDSEVLTWVLAHAKPAREPWEIAQWSAFREQATPADNESRAFVSEQVGKAGGGEREDIATWFDYLDFDDYVSFGGKP
ncbi:MAG: DUF5069 domain-containing protein [Verrucomicrobiales bacterium]|nr:DUF5069 domain-containing protein [Verrucomicrobiales bacterium]